VINAALSPSRQQKMSAIKNVALVIRHRENCRQDEKRMAINTVFFSFAVSQAIRLLPTSAVCSTSS
jgi:hypothetical protein